MKLGRCVGSYFKYIIFKFHGNGSSDDVIMTSFLFSFLFLIKHRYKLDIYTACHVGFTSGEKSAGSMNEDGKKTVNALLEYLPSRRMKTNAQEILRHKTLEKKIQNQTVRRRSKDIEELASTLPAKSIMTKKPASEDLQDEHKTAPLEDNILTSRVTNRKRSVTIASGPDEGLPPSRYSGSNRNKKRRSLFISTGDWENQYATYPRNRRSRQGSIADTLIDLAIDLTEKEAQDNLKDENDRLLDEESGGQSMDDYRRRRLSVRESFQEARGSFQFRQRLKSVALTIGEKREVL